MQTDRASGGSWQLGGASGDEESFVGTGGYWHGLGRSRKGRRTIQ